MPGDTDKVIPLYQMVGKWEREVENVVSRHRKGGMGVGQAQEGAELVEVFTIF